MIPDADEDVARIVRTLRGIRVSVVVFRCVPLRYATAVASVEGARKHGGRYNPPAELAIKCGLTEGFGYLYTATSPLTCLFECEHILRGLGDREFQEVPVEPTLLVSFRVDADNVLDLRSSTNQHELDVSPEELTGLDDRADLNESGAVTPLQRLGAIAYRSGFSGLVVPSRFSDVVPGYCFNFVPREVKLRVEDVEGVLRQITLLQPL